MNEQDFAELSAGQALNALSPDDEARYHRALADTPRWQQIARDDVDTAAALAADSTPVTPPPAIKAALLAAIAQTPQHGTSEDGPAGSVRAPERATVPADARDLSAEALPAPAARKRRQSFFALAACIVLLVAVSVGTFAIMGQLNQPTTVEATLDTIRTADDAQQATTVLEDGSGVTVYWADGGKVAALVAAGMEELGDDQSYEMWIIRGDKPVSAGVMESPSEGVIAGAVQPGDVIAITVEEAGGSSSGAPTSEPIATVTLS